MFKIGDRVKVTSGIWAGELGSVVELEDGYSEGDQFDYPIGVQYDNPPMGLKGTRWYHEDELEAIK